MAAKGRPTKLTDNFLKVMEEVLSDGLNIRALTDIDLIEEINDRLPEKEQVSLRSWKDWKHGNLKENDERLDTFFAFYKKAFRGQKRNMINSLEGEKQTWVKYAWIMERKFDEWNLRKKTENETKAEVSIVSEEDRNYVEKVINEML